MRTHIIHVTPWLDLVLPSTETSMTCLQSRSRMKWDMHLHGYIQKLGPVRDPRMSGSLRRKIRWSLFIQSMSSRSQRSSRLGFGSATEKGFGDSTLYMSEQVEILDTLKSSGCMSSRYVSQHSLAMTFKVSPVSGRDPSAGVGKVRVTQEPLSGISWIPLMDVKPYEVLTLATSLACTCRGGQLACLLSGRAALTRAGFRATYCGSRCCRWCFPGRCSSFTRLPPLVACLTQHEGGVFALEASQFSIYLRGMSRGE
jgi:hypothetical protein